MTTLFLKLYESVMVNERGWNPNDQGSVAFNGINRKYHPTWKGWPIIDKRLPAARGTKWPDLEGAAKEFYYTYFKNAGLDIARLTDFKVAALLADMATQHGRWKQIVVAGLYGGDPMNNGNNRSLTTADFNLLNNKPKDYYKRIADARLIYCQKVKLTNEGDRQGIINRAKKYVTDAIAYLKSNPTSGAAGLIAAVFFFIY